MRSQSGQALRRKTARTIPRSKASGLLPEYLKNNNWFPKRAPDIGHIIREAGNDVNHEVVMSDDSEAEVVILFTEAVLRTMYHYPAQVGELDQPPSE